MSVSVGFWDSLFGDKVTLELPDGKGGIVKRQVTKKWLDKMVAEGQISKAIKVNIFNSINGVRKEEWMVNEDIDYQTYSRFTQYDDELFFIEFYDDEAELKRMIVQREVYINAHDKFESITGDLDESELASVAEIVHSRKAVEKKFAAVKEEIQSNPHSDDSIRASWLKRLEFLMKEYQNEAFADRSHTLHSDFNAMIILNSVSYLRLLIQSLEIGSKMDQSFDEAHIVVIDQLMDNISKKQYRELTKYITSILFIKFLNNNISTQIFEMGIDEQKFRTDFLDGLQIDEKFIMTQNIQSLQRKILVALGLPITEGYIVIADGATEDAYNQFNNDFVEWVEDKYLNED